MSKKILITGGAGFIGSWVSDELIARGYDVRIYDNEEPQTHAGVPPFIHQKADYIRGDVCDASAMKKAVEDCDVVIHCAALTGSAQSEYERERYKRVNVDGSTVLANALRESSVHRVILASSMMVYGEGLYQCETHGTIRPDSRTAEQLSAKQWEMRCPSCGADMTPIAYDEEMACVPMNFYGQTKLKQENIMLELNAHGIDAVALRLFNVYGPRQSLKNPYCGAIPQFYARLKADRELCLYEDGNQSRDFIYIADVVSAMMHVVEHSLPDERVFNVGTGAGTPIHRVAEELIELMGKRGSPRYEGQSWTHHLRHVEANIVRMQSSFGWQPHTSMHDGLEQFVAWAEQKESADKFDEMIAAYKEHSLLTA